MHLLLLALFSIICIQNAQASIIELNPEETRFVAMRTDKVNARSGPNKRYPIEWIYQQQYHPVEIIAEYDQWRKIRDYEGATSWILKHLLTNSRYALITEHGENNIYEKDSLNSKVIARAENGVVGRLKKCTQTFCFIEFDAHIEGWVQRSIIYGIKKGEEIK